jgi:DNA-binding transcriptional MerR regulator
LFRQPEVCEIAQVQPYVLRSWEAEFQDLGVVKTEGGARVYRRADVERVLRIKHLLFVEGLTIAGARRKLQDEHLVATPSSPADLDDLLSSDVRERILAVHRSLRELSAMLGQAPGTAGEFVLEAPTPKKGPSRGNGAAGKAGPAKSPPKKVAKRK